VVVRVCLWEEEIDCFYVIRAIEHEGFEYRLDDTTHLIYEDGKLEYCVEEDAYSTDCYDITEVIEECKRQAPNPKAWEELLRG